MGRVFPSQQYSCVKKQGGGENTPHNSTSNLTVFDLPFCFWRPTQQSPSVHAKIHPSWLTACAQRLSLIRARDWCCLHCWSAWSHPWAKKPKERRVQSEGQRDRDCFLEGLLQSPPCQLCVLFLSFESTNTGSQRRKKPSSETQCVALALPGEGSSSRPEPREQMSYLWGRAIPNGRRVTLQICGTWQARARQELRGLQGFPPPFRSLAVTLILV